MNYVFLASLQKLKMQNSASSVQFLSYSQNYFFCKILEMWDYGTSKITRYTLDGLILD